MASTSRPLALAAAVLMGTANLIHSQEHSVRSPEADVDSTITVIPQPARVTRRPGHFTVTKSTVIWSDRASAAMAHQLARYLEPATGWSLTVRVGGARPARGAILLQRDTTLEGFGNEGYSLEVRPTRVVARARGAAGLFYAVQTLRQLLPPAIFREAPVRNQQWRIPSVAIEDHPRFGWRGGHLDVARHFMPKEFIKKYLDLLALHKMNRFHWHLTDDQGWRIEIRKYPELTRTGAQRTETLIGRQGQQRDTTQWRFDGTAHGGFYTQDDAREIVAYAAARFIDVVPEIEMPGHATAAIAAYPALGLSDGRLAVMTRWGVSDDILNADPSTISFMQDVLGEVLDIFPSRFIHIGGDEAEKGKWKASPRIQQRILELGLKNEDELQSWFIRQMDTFLTARGRRLVGWDEILDGGLAPNATVMSWRGIRGGLASARAGHDVVMAPNTFTYFDYFQSRDQVGEPIAIGGFLPLDSVYAYDPVPADLEARFVHHILGAQGQLWTEYMKDPKKVEYMAYPRMTALAEVVWSPREARDYSNFRGRLETHLRRLEALDVNFRKPE